MRSFNFRQLLPHLVAVGIFLIVALIFCKPALESGVAMKQADMVSVEGMRHQSDLYKEQHGHFPLWVTSMFSGMPAYQIAIEGHWNPLSIIDRALQLWLPQPMNFFFLACICFYFLCICLGLRPFAAIIGSLAFAYSTYSPIIITAGHITKMLTLAYSPAMMGAAILIFKRKYLLGFSLFMLFCALEINQSHQQVSYYVFFILAAMTIAYGIDFIRKGQVAHFAKSIGLMAVAGVIALAVSAITLLTVYDFAKDSKRGGMLVMDDSSKKNDQVEGGKTKGLSKEYAFQWSYGKTETWSLLFPGVMGYGQHVADRDGEQYVFPKLGEESAVANFLMEKMNYPPDQAANTAYQQSTALYWGDQPFTNGPVYLGAVICFLFILGMFVLDGKNKWWILSVSFLSVLLSWGSNFPAFNNWVFDNFPLYNKFRVPTMILIIPQILFPLMASMVVDKLSEMRNDAGWRLFLRGSIATAIVLALGFFTAMSVDYSKENKNRTAEFNKLAAQNDPDIQGKLNALGEAYRGTTDNRLYESIYSALKSSPDAAKTSREFISALREDRKQMFSSSLSRSTILILLAAGLIALFLRRKFNNTTILIAGLTVISSVELLMLGAEYLNRYSFEDREMLVDNEFPKSRADEQILADPDPNYRVFNTSGLDESRTSYYHKSIGGYHPAKLGIYDDLLAYQLNNNTNPAVVNMLNAKYIIRPDERNQPVGLQNPEALGNVWLVKGIKWVKGPAEEMKALYGFSPTDTAIVDDAFKSEAGSPGNPDSLDMIKMTSFDNDTIRYESNTKEARVAVFSEIYYKDWKAYLDGKPAPYFKTNYVLRGMIVPAGKHEIMFRFEPKLFFLGKQISLYASWLTFLIFLASLGLEWRKRNTLA